MKNNDHWSRTRLGGGGGDAGFARRHGGAEVEGFEKWLGIKVRLGEDTIYMCVCVWRDGSVKMNAE